MLAQKMAFSLISLIIIFALALVALPVAAADPFDVTFEGKESVTYAPADDPVPVTVMVTIKMGQSVADPAPSLAVFDKNGIPIVNQSDEPYGATIVESTAVDYVAMGTQREYMLTIDPLPEEGRMVAKVIVRVGELTTNDPTAIDDSGTLVKTRKKSYTCTITLTRGPAPNDSRPKVVSIQRLGPISQTVTSAFEEEKVTGAFDVRIVLTERPHGGLTLDKIQVDGGTASDLVVGVPFARRGGTDADSTILPHPSEGMYAHSGDAADGLAGVPVGADTMNVPLPTGPDQMYHQYRVTITPHRRADMVKISIKEFHDGALPFPNVYKPFNVGNKPNGREQLRLAVATTTPPLGAGFMVSLPQSAGTQTEATETASEATVTDNVAATAAVTAKDAVPDTSVIIPEEGQIYISEIMFARGVHGTLPQWIEISNGSRTEEVNLSGWTLTVENATADTDVSVGIKAKFTIPAGTRIDPSGQHDTPSTVLIVTDHGRNNLDGWMANGQVISLWRDQQVAFILLGVTNRRYSLLSNVAFKVTLAPPESIAVLRREPMQNAERQWMWSVILLMMGLWRGHCR